MICPSCSQDISPVTAFTGGGLSLSCPKCNCKLGAPAPETSSLETVQRSEPRPNKQRAQKQKQDKPLNVLRAAKARLKQVRSEIKTLRKLEQEERELSRIIKAAETPVAEVTPIRKSS